MKVAVIGGGSTYTPELMDGLIQHARELQLDQVALMDVDSERLDVVGSFCERMRVHAKVGFSLVLTRDVVEAISGADFVLTQVRVGGQAGRHKDIQLGLGQGLIGQETTGVGGFAKALRTVPVILELCRSMDVHCPEAWLINFTNPSGIVTEAVLKHGRERAIGLCNIPINLKMDAAELLGVDSSLLELDYIGLNHLSWVRKILVDGQDVLPDALARFAGAGRPANIPEELDYPDGFLEALGAIPCSYLRYYYQTREALAELQGKKLSRAQEVMEVEEELLESYRDQSLCQKPEALEKRGGAYYSMAAVELIRAILSDSEARHVVNVRNGTTIAALPPDCAVEVACRVGAQGAEPLPLDPPGPEIRGLMQQVKAYEEMAVAAAVGRKRKQAILALTAHPLVADAGLAMELVDQISQVHGVEFEDS